MKRFFKSKIAPFVIIGIGVVIFIGLKKMRNKPQRLEKAIHVPRVKVVCFTPVTEQFIVNGTGTVRPSKVVNVIPQVQGEIISVSKNMENGGFFKRGEILFRIDPAEYRLRLAQVKSTLAIQKVQMQVEEEEGRIALVQWSEYRQNNPNEKAGSLTLREPQREMAKANLDAAKAQVGLAELNLKRTTIRAPFNGRVKVRNISTGQIVGPQTVLATIYDIDKAFITVPVRKEEAIWLSIPRSSKDKNRPPATITSEFGDRTYAWTGTLVRDEAELDMKSRMVGLVIEVDKPYDNIPDKSLVSGLFVEVEILGKMMENLYKIPRNLLHGNSKVWIANNGKLEIRAVLVLRFYKDIAYIQTGINSHDAIIFTRLDGAVDGMKIKVDK